MWERKHMTSKILYISTCYQNWNQNEPHTHTQTNCFTLRAGIYPSPSQLNHDITAWKVNMAGQWGQQVKRHFNHCSLSYVMMEKYPQALCYRCNLFIYIKHTLQTSLEATITRSINKNTQYQHWTKIYLLHWKSNKH